MLLRSILTPPRRFPAAEAALKILALAVGVLERYQQAKDDRAALDFRDLLMRSERLLAEHSGLRRRLASQIRLLLVDEFQDTDPLQVSLVTALCGGDVTSGKLFFVGDFKQSIYRFRGADPQVFRRLREQVPQAGRLSLTLNFRSQPAILQFVNVLFADSLGHDNEPLRPHRRQVTPLPAIEFLWALPSKAASDDPHAGDDDSRGDAVRREADWIARRLRHWIDCQAPLVQDAHAARGGESATRAVRPGDIAILFRRFPTWPTMKKPCGATDSIIISSVAWHFTRSKRSTT